MTTFGQVFDSLAKELLLGALEGINATVFAYGQTGSGKTFTITGGPERYADRGLIPRSITFLFQMIAQRRTALHKVWRARPPGILSHHAMSRAAPQHLAGMSNNYRQSDASSAHRTFAVLPLGLRGRQLL